MTHPIAPENKFSFDDILKVAAGEKLGVLAMISTMQAAVAKQWGDCRLLNRLIAAKVLAIKLGYKN